MARESVARRQAQSVATRAWHNELPRLIREDPRFMQMKAQHKQTLQAIADACHPAAGEDDSLVGAVGGRELMVACVGLNRDGRPRRSSFWLHIAKLEGLGFLVVMGRRGIGGRQQTNIYGIPARPGGLDARRSSREMCRMVADEDGRVHRQVLQPGEQPGLWPDVTDVTTHRTSPEIGLVRKQTSPEIGRVQVAQNRPDRAENADSQKLTSPETGRIHGCMGVCKHKSKPHAKTGVKSAKKGSEKRLRHIEEEDLRDTMRLVHLFRCAVSAGLVDSSEHGLLQFVAAAEHALTEGKRPCALFADIVNRGRWLFITAADEQTARGRLKQAQRFIGGRW